MATPTPPMAFATGLSSYTLIFVNLYAAIKSFNEVISVLLKTIQLENQLTMSLK